MISSSSSSGTARADLLARVTVVIPVLNEERDIEVMLGSLLPWCEGAEVLVMDGGSTDATAEIVERIAVNHPNLTLQPNPGRSQAAALNHGVQLAEPGRDIIIRCDAHGRYPPDFVAGLAAKLDELEAESVVVPMDAVARPGANCQERALALVADTPMGAGGSLHRGGRQSGWVDHGHHAAFRRDRFEALGGYDTTLIANEDAEFDTRLTRAGGRIWLAADIRMEYFVRRSLSALGRQYWRYGIGRAIHSAKHGISLKPRQAIPVLHVVALLGSALILLVAAVAPPLAPLGLVYPVTYLSAILVTSLVIGLRRRNLCAALIPAALATLHTAWGAGYLAGQRQARRQIQP